METNAIKEARENAGMTIKELAELLGAPYRTVQDWNAGKRQPPPWIERLVLEKIDRHAKERAARLLQMK